MAFTNEETARAMAAIQAASEKSGQSVADLLRTYESIRQTMESSGGQGGDIAAHNANPGAHNLAIANATSKIRRKLTANVTYHVRKDGNDNNDGLAADTAFLTIDRARDELRRIDGCGFAVSLRLGTGQWGGLHIEDGMLIGASQLRILTEAASGTIIDASNTDPNNGIAVRGRYKVDVWNLTIQNSAVAVLARDGASVSLTNVNFVGATATDRLIQVQTKGEVFLMGNSTVSGKASSFIYATDGAVEFFNPTVSLVNSPEITSFFNLRHSFATFGGSATFTGSSVGRKYYMVAGSILQTGGRGEVVIPGGSIASIKDASCFVV